jgi:hypothetical protein
MRHQKLSNRLEYRQTENQRVKDSASLAAKFRKLKALTVELAYFTGDRANRSSQVKYKVNLDNARSVFRFNCPNNECVCGDFDLSDQLASAVRKRSKVVEGELFCQGWRNRSTVDTLRCNNVLRYKLTLAY